ncbi:MAG: hypothetical protein ABSE72_08225 [Bacteroidales bacterium]|jgi:hypothetical protein
MKVIKYLLLFFVFILFGLHIIQQTFHVFHQASLIGVTDSTKCPALTKGSYFHRKFQPVFQKYVEEKMGFRPTFIKLRNQFNYSVFNYTEASGVVIGKKGMLFLESYIQNCRGSVFKGEEQIKNEVKRLKMIQDELKRHNVDFLLIFAPGKATFYSELIPDHYKQRPVTNYQTYLKTLSGSGIHFIDMNAWFRALKGKTPYPLYPLNGTHWTTYGIGIAADTMFRYIEKLRNISLPEFGWDKVTISDSMRYTDNDIGELMNLWRPLKHPPMPYLHFTYNQKGKTRPKVISIGDSYWWGFTYTAITANVFTKDYYWFYFRDIMENEQKTGLVANVNLKEHLFNQDMVILMVTEATYQLFPYGFIESFFKNCMPMATEARQMKIEEYIVKIKNDPAWYQSVVEKARTNGHSIEEQIKLDAQFMVDQEEKK